MKLSEVGEKLLNENNKEINKMVLEGKFPLPINELIYIISAYAIDNRNGLREECFKNIKEIPKQFIINFLNQQIPEKHLYLMAYIFQNDIDILEVIFSKKNVPISLFEKFSNVRNKELLKILLKNEEIWTKSPSIIDNFLNNPELPVEYHDKISFYITKTLTESTYEQKPLLTPKEEEEHKELIENVSEDDEEKKRSIAGKISKLSVAEKIKFALMGNKEVRGILIKDSNKLVSTAVLKNPRITEGEIVKISQDKNLPDEIIRAIASNKNWIQNYSIRLNLVYNPKTPVPVSVKFLSSLSNKDLDKISKSRNVSSIITASARKILVQRSK